MGFLALLVGCSGADSVHARAAPGRGSEEPPIPPRVGAAVASSQGDVLIIGGVDEAEGNDVVHHDGELFSEHDSLWHEVVPPDVGGDLGPELSVVGRSGGGFELGGVVCAEGFSATAGGRHECASKRLVVLGYTADGGWTAPIAVPSDSIVASGDLQVVAAGARTAIVRLRDEILTIDLDTGAATTIPTLGQDRDLTPACGTSRSVYGLVSSQTPTSYSLVRVATRPMEGAAGWDLVPLPAELEASTNVASSLILCRDDQVGLLAEVDGALKAWLATGNGWEPAGALVNAGILLDAYVLDDGQIAIWMQPNRNRHDLDVKRAQLYTCSERTCRMRPLVVTDYADSLPMSGTRLMIGQGADRNGTRYQPRSMD